MIRRPPRSTRTDTLFPYTTLFRSTDKGIAIGAAQLLDAIGRRDGDANVARRVIIVPLLTNLYFLASARRVADVLAELGAPGVLIDLLALLHDVFERRRINGLAIGVRAHHEFPGFVTGRIAARGIERRSEEHTSELQSLMRISYAVFCLK